MRKIVFVLIYFLSSYLAINAQVNLTQGLAAYYPFNGNANDVSGNNNNPTFNNATLTADRNGNANSAYHFNGINNYMQVPNSSTLSTGNTVTVSAMVKADGFYYGLCHGNSILIKGLDANNPSSNYLLRFSDFVNNCGGGIPDTTKEYFYANDVGSIPYFPIQKSKWYSIIFTYDGTVAKFYINCTLLGQATVALNFNNSDDLFFGKMNSTVFPYWLNADLDEIRIYNRAINQDEVLALNDVSKPEFTFNQNICNPKQLTLKNETINYTKFYWNFGNGTIDSTTIQPIVNYNNYGNYNISLVVANNFGCTDTISKNIPLNLTNDNSLLSNPSDTSICSGASFKLNTKDTGFAYCWTVTNGVVPNNSSPSVSPTTNTTYYYHTQTLGSNLIVNGDFESGNTGFSSGYSYEAPPNTTDAVFYISNNPSLWNPAFSNCGDHTTGNQKMLLVNGSVTPDIEVWTQNITIQPNTNYAFSVWLQSIFSTNPAQLKLSINGVQIGELFQAQSTTCKWERFYVVWNSGSNTTAKISVVNKSLQFNGNDFALDDISFAPVSIKTDSVNVTVNNCNIPCNQVYNWTTWQNFLGTSATGVINNSGQNVNVTMTANYTFSSTPSIYSYPTFNSFNSNIPNATVPQTTWSVGVGGTTTMCFNQQVKNPVLLLSSIGSLASPVSLKFSRPYTIVYDGGGNVFNNDTTITGAEGYAIIMFPGDFTCVSIYSTTPEFYTNITWGLNPPLFAVTITGNATNCDSVSLSANGGVSYLWNGGLYPNSKDNVFKTSGTYFVTITDAANCKVITSVDVIVNNCNLNTTCKGVIELHGHDKVIPPNPIKQYFPNTGFTWETWFNGSYYVNNNTTIDTRSKLISALDLPQCQDIVLGFGWPQVAQKNTLCFVADGPNGCGDRDNTPCTYFPVGGFQPNIWYHVAAVRDYANNTSKLYINGGLVDSKSNTHGPINPTLLPGFIFGSWLGIGPTDSGFAGKMDEIRIWNKPRTAVEIQANYNKCLLGNETGLIAYYHSNEKSGTILHDVSINPKNATLSSGVTFNKNDNAPIANPCALITSSDTTKTINQGQSYWGYSATGIYKDTFVNSLGCDSIRTLNLTVISNVAKASFTAPDTVCVNSPITVNNTSTGATTYNWNFCNANVNGNPITNNLGNIGNSFSRPVFIDYIQVGTNFYGFLVNHDGSLIRLDFGNNLLNIPTTVSLGNVGGIMNLGAGNEGIQVVKQNGNYFIFIVGGNPVNGTTPKLMRFAFGNSITNTTPVATDFGNIGNMLEAIDLYIFQDNGHYYGFTANAENNTLTRFDFSTDLNNTPTAINMGNIGGLLNYPTGINAINDNGFWRVFLANAGNSTLLRLDFGTSLLNTPTAINLGNPNNAIDAPRDLIMESYCDGIVGFVVNGTSNTITRINLSTFTSIPTCANLGNIGNFNFPHSLTKLFRSGSDVYSFVTNVNNNTLTRLKFQGCTNSSLPNSTAATPPSISYNSPGTYNINLTIDDGLATQSVYCKQIFIVAPKKDSINYTICKGENYFGYSATGIYKDTFHFTTGCDSIRTINLTVNPVKKDSINKSICNTQSFLGYNTTGVYRDTFKITGSCDSIRIINLVVDKYVRDSIIVSICFGDTYAGHSISEVYNDTINSTTSCDTIRRVNLMVRNKPTPQLINDASICQGDSLQLIPGVFKFYLWSNNSTADSLTVKNVGTYWVIVTDTFGCKATDTFHLISINKLPKDFLPNSLSVCPGEPYTLNGYVSYNWMTGETTSTISLNTFPVYTVKVIDNNGCNGSDSMTVSYLGGLNIQPVNAFSPNGDGVNETFQPFTGVCVTKYSLKIFDRWGQLLFETINPNTGWNGKYNGTTLPMGVYYYIINYKNLVGVDSRKTGSITLLR